MGKKRQKSIISLLLSAILILSCCSGCGKVEEKQSEFAGDKGKMWKEDWTITQENGKEVSVSAHALMHVPEMKQISTVDVAAYELTKENKEKIRKGLFEDSVDITKEMRKNQDLEIIEARLNFLKSCSEEYRTDVDSEIQKEYFKVVWNQTDYFLRFSSFGGELKKKDQIDLSTVEGRDCLNGPPLWMEIVDLFPMKEETVYPEEVKKWSDVSYFGESRNGTGGKRLGVNQCKLTEEEAREKAKNFLSSAGIPVMTEETQDLVWDGRTQQKIRNGYLFIYRPGTDEVVFPETDELIEHNLLRDYKEKDFRVYSSNCAIYVFVTDKGVIRASINNPVIQTKITKNVKTLSFDKIKQIVKNEMPAYLKRRNQINKKLELTDTDIEKVVITRINFMYMRMDVDVKKGSFTYAPVWEVKIPDNFCGNLYVNAIDGTIIDSWKDIV